MSNIAHPLTGDDNQCYLLHNVMFDCCIINTAIQPVTMKLHFKHSQKMLLTHCCNRPFQQTEYIHIYKSIFHISQSMNAKHFQVLSSLNVRICYFFLLFFFLNESFMSQGLR